MGDKPNHESLMTPFKPPRKIDRPNPSTSKPQRLISKRRRRTSSYLSDSPEPSYDSNSVISSDSEEEDQNQDLFPPTYPLLTPPTSSPPLRNPQKDQDPHSDSDSDSDSLFHVSAYDILLARIRERRGVGVEKSSGVERSGEGRGVKREYEMERVKKRPFIAPAVALKEEEEEEEKEEKEEIQRVGGRKMKVNPRMRPDSEVEVEMEMGSEGNDSDSSGELKRKKREVFVGQAYKRPRRVESSESMMDRQERSKPIMKHKDDSSYAMPDEERLDSQESQEDWLPSPEQVFGIGRAYSKSTSDSEAS